MATIDGHGPPFLGDDGAYHNPLKGAIDGGNIWWVAPSFPIASQIWRDAKKAAEGAWSYKSESERRIDFASGGSLTIKSADNPDSLRGQGLDGLVMDEAAFCHESVWKLSLRPALADKQGWAIFISTPNGYNWFKDLFDNAGTENGWGRWQRPTSDNPLIPPEELEAAKLDMGLRGFEQEHGAQFVTMADAEWPGYYFGDKIWFDEWPAPALIQFKVMSLDPSKGETERSDYSAFIMMALALDGIMYVDAVIERLDTQEISRRALEMGRLFNPDAFGIETNQFQKVLSDNIARESRDQGFGLPIWEINHVNNKLVRIRAGLTPYLSRGEIRFKRGSPGCKLLVEQLRSFPLPKVHDDGPDALEMALQVARGIFQEAAV